MQAENSVAIRPGSRLLPGRRRSSGGLSVSSRSGFTLLELAIVVFLIGIVAAMAVPQLLPIIAFSELEGSARRVAGFGQGAMAHAALLRERVVVRIDLKAQELYAVHWVVPETEEELAEQEAEEPDQLEKLSQLRELGIRSPSDLQEEFMGGNDYKSLLGDEEGTFDAELAAFQMTDKFNAFAREALEVRAKNVKHDESLLDDVGVIFDEGDGFALDEEEPVEEELADPILRRTGLRGDVEIVGVELDGEYSSRGEIEVEFSVLGLTQKVVLYLEDAAGEAYTVLWDPVSNRSNIFRGRRTDL